MQHKISWFKRFRFGGSARVEIYEMLALLLENRVLLIDALREIRGVLNDSGLDASASNDDLKIRNVKAEAVHSWITHLKTGDKDGFALARAIEPWVPLEETALIQSGEATGELVRALNDCVAAIQSKGQMMGAVLGGTVYPTMLLVASWFVMRMFAKDVIPRFVAQVDPEMWEGPAKFLYVEVELFNRFGVPLAIFAIVSTIVVIATLPFLRGSFRVFLDKYVPPWNIYKMIQGATFLKNIAVQTRAGIRLYDSISQMNAIASPWLKDRLQATLYGIQQGQNLGDALYNAEYEFPDRRSVQILRVLSSRDGFDETVYNFAGRWQEQTVKRVKSASMVFFAIGILTIGFVAGSCFLGIQGLTALIEEYAESATSSAER